MALAQRTAGAQAPARAREALRAGGQEVVGVDFVGKQQVEGLAVAAHLQQVQVARLRCGDREVQVVLADAQAVARQGQRHGQAAVGAGVQVVQRLRGVDGCGGGGHGCWRCGEWGGCRRCHLRCRRRCRGRCRCGRRGRCWRRGGGRRGRGRLHERQRQFGVALQHDRLLGTAAVDQALRAFAQLLAVDAAAAVGVGLCRVDAGRPGQRAQAAARRGKRDLRIVGRRDIQHLRAARVLGHAVQVAR